MKIGIHRYYKLDQFTIAGYTGEVNKPEDRDMPNRKFFAQQDLLYKEKLFKWIPGHTLSWTLP